MVPQAPVTPQPPEKLVVIDNEHLGPAINSYVRSRVTTHAPQTILAAEKTLWTFFNWLDGAHVTLYAIRTYFQEGSRLRARAYMKETHKRFKTFFKWLVKEQLVPFNPMPLVPTPGGYISTPKRPYTYEEYCTLRDGAHPFELKWTIIAQYNTGLRTSGVAMLRWKDIDQDERTITTIEPKMKRMAIKSVVPYTPYGDVEKCLWELHRVRDDQDDSWPGAGFACKKMAASYIGKPHTYSFFFHNLCAQLGVENLGLHSMRRAFCSNIANHSGLNAITAMKLTGHTDYKTYAKYITVDSESLREGLTKAFAKVQGRGFVRRQLKEGNGE